MDAINLGMLKITGEICLEMVTSYLTIEQVNEQTEAYICGNVTETSLEYLKKNNVIGKALTSDYSHEGKFTPLFRGIIQEASFSEVNKNVQIKCKGSEILLDRKKEMVFFQNINTTYYEMIKETMEGEGILRYKANKQKHIDAPVIRFQETIWEFTKRMAGRMETVMYPIANASSPAIEIGLTNQKVKDLVHVLEEKLKMDMEGYIEDQKKISKESYISLEVVSYQHLELGDRVKYQNRLWNVMKKTVKSESSLLSFKYVLGCPINFRVKKYGLLIAGCSINGKVKDVKHEALKIHFSFDSNNEKEKLYFFPYRPTTGNVMYSMPEIGENVALYFPNEFEENAFVIHGRHKTEKCNKKIKYIRTPYGKLMDLSPEGLELCAAENEKGGVSSISLEDNSHISFHSSQKITIKANERIKVKSRLSATVVAHSNVLFKQKDTINYIEIYENNIISSAEKYRMSSGSHSEKASRKKSSHQVSFQSIENNLKVLGAFSPGVCGTLEQRILSCFPACTYPQDVQIQTGIGLNVKRRY